jgi:pimeloyl-ACP methyl ester carboxylesterase
MQNHVMPTPLDALNLPLSSGSTARWARQGARACLVFVHGYGGRAVATWGDFPDMAMEHPDYSDVDLVFLGYESRSRSAPFSVGVIFEAVTHLAEKSRDFISKVGGPDRPAAFSYEEIILVGHSLGGAIVRDVAMSAKELGKPWAETIRLALFAPAHCGAQITDLVRTGVGFIKWLGPLWAIAYTKSPVLRDLELGSPYLAELLAKAVRIGVHCTTTARLVAHAANDPVVFHNTFFRDPPLKPYLQQDHVSCCKPVRQRFEEPVVDLARVLV